MPGEQGAGLRRVRRVAVVVFAVQLGVMLWWSSVLWRHFSLTNDYAQYWQAWSHIAHGHLNPTDSFGNEPFWHDHSVFLMWPIALITHFGLGGYAPLAVQDLGVVSAELIAFTWLVRLLHERSLGLPMPDWSVAAISLVLLTCNPWIYWAISFDIHLDITLAAPFVVLTLRALYYRHLRQLIAWATCCALCGDIAMTYLAAVGLCGLAASVSADRRRLRPSLALLLGGAAGFVVESHVGGATGTGSLVSDILRSNGLGAGKKHHAASGILDLARHPGALISSLSQHPRNYWALISPAGFIGLLSPWGLPLAAVTAVENGVGGPVFSAQGFQYAALWAPLVVAGILAARTLVQRRWGGPAVTVLLVASLANTVAWAGVWLPHLSTQWDRVDSAAVHALDHAERLIPSNAEVIASNGVVGRFAARDVTYAYTGPESGGRTVLAPVFGREIFFVVVPYQGIEPSSVADSLRLIAHLADDMNAELLIHDGGVWVFEWAPPPGATAVALGGWSQHSAVPAWAARSEIGRPLVTGPAPEWNMTTTDPVGGYLLDGAYFNEPAGNYALNVQLMSNGPINVEAWNAGTSQLIGRRILPATGGLTTVTVPVSLASSGPTPVFRGHSVFSDDPPAPPAGQVVEARVYLPAGTTAKVYSVQLLPASAS
ncbi:MAG TPA: hypothetical protein VG899_10195 [Mycobacteriales bacterium]|nr:hypothetical protein [Mycobacteriales bacterium]